MADRPSDDGQSRDRIDGGAGQVGRSSRRIRGWNSPRTRCFACHHDLKPEGDGDIGSTWRQHPCSPTHRRLAAVGDMVRPARRTLSAWALLPRLQAAIRLPSWRHRSSQRRRTPSSFSQVRCGNSPALRVASITARQVRHSQVAGRSRGSRIRICRAMDDVARNYLAGPLYQSLTDFDPARGKRSPPRSVPGLAESLAYPPAAGDCLFNSPKRIHAQKYQQALDHWPPNFANRTRHDRHSPSRVVVGCPPFRRAVLSRH